MKKSFFIIVCFVFFLMAGSFKGIEQNRHSIEGTWELQSFYSYDGRNVVDTIEKSDGYRQVKMYSKEKIMWTRYVPDDPNGRFGYGSYRTTDSSLIEIIEYGDDEMMKALDTMRNFTFELLLTEDSFSQITVDNDGNRTFSENYRRID
ncbi:hypothetical protein D2V93_01655 [Flagellimonas taeanensis]|uniref:hypothetical protein n=1 Tax=Flavobacteriaceae TaxID=49546 RepID=UPI000E68A024|nr:MULTISPECIES: hypothetical protein [Allomuricauda]MDC6384742.1 hypothetical protein [Muricauda sp. SK9]RIV53518.1 hypothetical protein D2V93_01655 [Allomuricauda taeanensis]